MGRYYDWVTFARPTIATTVNSNYGDVMRDGCVIRMVD